MPTTRRSTTTYKLIERDARVENDLLPKTRTVPVIESSNSSRFCSEAPAVLRVILGRYTSWAPILNSEKRF